MIRTTFLMEQHAGHLTYYQNLRQFIDPVQKIAATWVPVTYSERYSWLNHLPLTHHLRGMLLGRQQVWDGLNVEADVRLFNTQVPAGLTLNATRHRPYVLATDITPLQYDGMAQHYGHILDGSRLVRAVKHRVNTRLFKQAARILPWSSWVAQSLIVDYGVDPNKIDVIHPGVDTTLWVPKADVPHDKVRILFVGGDFERKGGQLLLKAFRNLPSDSAELHIVTRSHVQPATNLFVYRNMRPNSAELIHLYQTCDVFCMPTLAEAFGIVCAEASACGLPIISTNVGGLRDVVADGKTGFLVTPGDMNELTERLCQLVERADLRDRMGRAARRRAVRQFDACRNAWRIINALEKVVNETTQL